MTMKKPGLSISEGRKATWFFTFSMFLNYRLLRFFSHKQLFRARSAVLRWFHIEDPLI
jgi:hypothetical protein